MQISIYILSIISVIVFDHHVLGQFDNSYLGETLNHNRIDFDVQNNNATAEQELEQTFNRTNVRKLRSALSNLRQKWSSRLQQRPSSTWQDGQTKTASEMEQKPLREKPRDRIKPEGDTLHDVNKAAGLNDLLYQGDMVLTEEQITTILEDSETDTTPASGRSKRQAYRDRYYPSTTWGASVYYYYDKTATPKIIKAFEKAVQFWQNVTCINIYQSTTAINRIRVFKGQGCYSYVGRISGVQDLSLGTGCEEFGTAAHELGHALGFFHTQSRFDRDNSISINYANIDRSYVEQFDKETSSTNYNYGMPYDYGSIMQYGATSASSNGKATMIARDAEYQDTMGSDFVAFYDISMMNEHYKCKELCNSLISAKCTNGGFPNSRNCNICICPSGYGGDLCDQRPAGCGSELQATADWQTVSNTIGDGLPTLRDDHTICYYWVKAPVGQAIEIRINSLSAVTIDGCTFGGIEIKTHKDQNLTGYRYCSSQDQNTVHKSTGSLVPIVMFNRYASTKAVLDYRYVNATSNTNTPQQVTLAPVVNSCQDLHPNCAAYAWNGFCVNPFYSVDARRYYCARTCNLCWTFY